MPAPPPLACSQVTVRVMDIDQFMNSKRLFKDVRHRPKAQQPAKPVTVCAQEGWRCQRMRADCMKCIFNFLG